MSFSGFSFILWRMLEIITLIPTLGMLAWFVHFYDSSNQRTPTEILVLFIVSVLGAAWAIGTLFLYTRAKHSAGFVAFVDLLFVGAFIGAVVTLRDMAKADCTSWDRTGVYNVDLGIVTVSGNKWGLHTNKLCAMLKACFAFGIMNCIFFFITFVLALLVHRHHESRDRVVVKRETSHVSRHGHRSHRSRSPRHSHHSRRTSSHYV
ncbi:hypothetical protein K505DRAFT_281363 [Melanomma pulvis-pyrius CBS 109.77]|uniref:MARVEL domain-containing protein n=1 Tax=Melanomma pulvis-pyrius CBS 109.77 TaxID=1314802 RepID=A0A6A6X4N0_9PLEO|nr:hypothetical protein K505DRAFT_281363 [Melanomma pulvis-pyrius CBS 109.77]